MRKNGEMIGWPGTAAGEPLKKAAERGLKRCPNCGTEFERRGLRKYCSLGCSIEFQKKQRRKEPEKKFCAVCGKEFLTVRGYQRTCSHRCSQIYTRTKSSVRGLLLVRNKRRAMKASENKRMAGCTCDVHYRRDEYTGVTVETRGQYCWSGGPSIVRGLR